MVSIRKKLFSLPLMGAAAALAVMAGTQAAQAAKYEMVIAHIYPENLQNNEVQPSLKHFESQVEAATNGDIDVKIFGAGQLGTEVETAQAAQAGRTVQASVISSGAMSSFYKNYQIITTPFLFPNYQVAFAYFDGPWHAKFMKGAIKESGLRYLATFDDGGGFVAFTNNKRLIKTVDDLKGMKIRVEENPAHIATLKALGASATPLPWGEVQTALATGLADGQFNAPGISKAFKLWDVNDYTTLSGLVYNSSSFMVSEKWFESLPQKYRDIIVEAAHESAAIGHGIAAMQSIDGWQASCKHFKKCYILPQSERDKMKALARPAWRDWITKDFGIKPELVDGLWTEVDRLTKDIKTSVDQTYAD